MAIVFNNSGKIQGHMPFLYNSAWVMRTQIPSFSILDWIFFRVVNLHYQQAYQQWYCLSYGLHKAPVPNARRSSEHTSRVIFTRGKHYDILQAGWVLPVIDIGAAQILWTQEADSALWLHQPSHLYLCLGVGGRAHWIHITWRSQGFAMGPPINIAWTQPISPGNAHFNIYFDE